MLEKWTILKLLDWTAPYLKQKGIPSPRLEAEVLLAHILGLKRIQLYTLFDRPLSEAELAKFKALLKRRAEREPLAYLLGKKEFYSLEFLVSSATLIPRPETELLIDEVVEEAKIFPEQNLKILEIGTGSGCIAVTLAKQLPKAQITTLDVSTDALTIARENAKRHSVENQIEFIQDDFLNSKFEIQNSRFDFLVSNPPYIPSADLSKLEPELQHEPRQALEGGESGLIFYEKILPYAQKHLKEAASVFLEIGWNQGQTLEEIAKACGFSAFKIVKDFSGLDRVFIAHTSR